MSERYAWGAQDLSRASINNRPAPPRRVELKRGMVLEDLNTTKDLRAQNFSFWFGSS